MKYIKIEAVSVPVAVVRSNRKTLGIEVSPDGQVTARTPMKINEEYIRQFILAKSGWIEKHIQKAYENNKKLEELVPFSGDEIRAMAEKALKIIPERVSYYAQLIDVTYGKITIRSQKTKWGSCSSSGNLNFNCLLVMTPPEVLDSIVVHELCHRKYMNHSKEFYAEVRRIFPEYDKCNKWLKENGAILIRRMIEHKPNR